jgi:hypothetical protein
VEVAQRTGNLYALRRAHWYLAEHDVLAGSPEAARDRLLPLLDRSSEQETEVTQVLALLAIAYLETGAVAQAETLVTQSVARATAEQNQGALLDGLRAQALLALRQEQWQRAELTLEQALALSRGLCNPYYEAQMRYLFGLLRSGQGEPEQAREHLEAALAMLKWLGERLCAERIERALAQLGP